MAIIHIDAVEIAVIFTIYLSKEFIMLFDLYS